MIYAAGMSNGAMFSHTVGAELSDVIGAIAPVYGSVGRKADADSKIYTPSITDNPVAVIMLNSLKDKHV
jgi:poly(3-hydroxybutyrate) depolymerase